MVLRCHSGLQGGVFTEALGPQVWEAQHSVWQSWEVEPGNHRESGWLVGSGFRAEGRPGASR